MKKYFLLPFLVTFAMLAGCTDKNPETNKPGGEGTGGDSESGENNNGGNGGDNEGGETEVIDYTKSLGVDKTKPHNAYQLLIYSFSDSDGDGFGDLKGVENKLDYIKDLGFDVIWLSPVMPCENYHGYDVTSFYGIDEKIGTLDDYKSLVVEAHKKDIKLVLDMPINHTSINHEWFKGFANGEEKYAHYYQEKDPSINYGTTSSMGDKAKFYQNEFSNNKTYFAAFGEKMPDLNYQSEELKEGIKEVFKYWIDLGTDGFRFDAIKHIYDVNEIDASADSLALNNEFFESLNTYLKSMNPNIYTVGENFSGNDEVKKYAASFDSEFDFETWHKALGAVTNNDPWGQQDCRKTYDDTVVGVTKSLVETNPDWLAAGMSGNHDITRAASYIGDKVADDGRAFKLYASMLMLRRGMPYVYYGDEIGLFGENKGTDKPPLDAEVRLPMTFSDSTIDISKVFTFVLDDGSILSENVKNDWPNWKADNPQVDDVIADTSSLYHTYKNLIAFRNEHPAIYKGNMELGIEQGESTIYKTTFEDETLYVAFNFSENETTYTGLSDDMKLLYDDNDATIDGSNLVLGGRGVAVFTSESELTPTEGYALLVSGADGTTRYVKLTYNKETEGFNEYMALGCALNEGDTFKIFNYSNKDSWALQKLNPGGASGSFTPTDNGIVCNASGTYDIYLKLKYQADEIYLEGSRI